MKSKRETVILCSTDVRTDFNLYPNIALQISDIFREL